MPKYTPTPARIAFSERDSAFYVSVFDEGAGKYIAISTKDFPDSTTDMEAIWLESPEDVDDLAAQLKELLK